MPDTVSISVVMPVYNVLAPSLSRKIGGIFE
jgi:hypothetical protein